MTRILLWGGSTHTPDPPSFPKVWRSSPATSDDNVPLKVVTESLPFAPAGFGGECLFAWAYLTITASLSAQLRVTPVVDGTVADIPLVSTGGVIQVVRPILTLAQQTATQPGQMPQRVTRTFPVPLLRRTLTADGVEQFRSYVRGARLQLRIESVGALGVGELIVDGCDVEYDVLRKASYEPVSA